MVMVKRGNQCTPPAPSRQEPEAGKAEIPEPPPINANTPFDFEGKNLTAYGGLLPVATMLEKLRFRELVEETLQGKRQTRAMSVYQFVLTMVLGAYVGFSRLYHLRFLEREPMLVGILKVLRLPPQCTFWRFLASWPMEMAWRVLEVQRRVRERVWEAAHVRLKRITVDTDTTVHTLFGHQMGARKGYNPRHKGKKSYQPILSFLAQTKEYVMGELHNGDRPRGDQIVRHLKRLAAALPPGVKEVWARADAGFYCREAVEEYERLGWKFIISASKTPALVDALRGAKWKPSPRTPADGQCEFRYQPTGWGKAYRFIALRYEKEKKVEPGQPVQYQLFDTPEYSYRVFVTNRMEPVEMLEWLYNQRAGAENLIKEANNDAGLAAYPSSCWAMNCNHFQLAMLAYNLNCWLLLFNREEKVETKDLKHITLATARLRFLFLAAKIWRHGGRVGVSYSDQYPEKGMFQRLMERLRAIAVGPKGYAPVLAVALRC
jgi:hypothetical protein